MTRRAHEAPAWYAHDPDELAPLPGLPEFVTLSWVRSGVILQDPHLGRLYAAAAQGLAADGLSLPGWWPATPPLGHAHHFVAMAMADPVLFGALLRISERQGNRNKHDRKVTFFAAARDMHDERDDESREEHESHALLIDFLEYPAAAEERVARIMADPQGADAFTDCLLGQPSGSGFLAWLGVHYPRVAASFSGSAATSPLAARVPAPPPVPALVDPPAPVRPDVPVDPPMPEASGHDPVTGPGDAPDPAPGDDPEAEAMEMVCRSILSGLSEAASSLAKAGRVDRPSLAPVVAGALRASRAVRTLERHRATPLDASDVLDTIAAALAEGKKFRLSDFAMPPAPLLVTRAKAPGLRAMSETLASGTSELAGLTADVFRLADDIRGDKVGIGTWESFVEAQRRAQERGTALNADIEATLAMAEAVRYVPPAPRPSSVPAPAPAAAPARIPQPEPDAAAAYVPVHYATTLNLGAPDGETAELAMRLCLSQANAVDDGNHPPSVTGTGPGNGWGCRWTVVSGGLRLVHETTLADVSGRVLLTVRVTEPDGPVRPRTLPALVTSALMLLDPSDGGRAPSQSPVSMRDYGAFHALVFAPDRILPVVAFAIDASGAGFKAEAAAAAKALEGAAHVILVQDALQREISERLSIGWSVYDKAVRLYAPGAVESDKDRTRHPTFPRAVVEASLADGAGGFLADLYDRVHAEGPAVSGPSFRELEGASAETPAGAAAGPAAPSDTVLAGDLGAAIARGDRLEEENARLASEQADQRALHRDLALRVEELSRALAARGTPAPRRPDPVDLDGLVDYARHDMGPHVLVQRAALDALGCCAHANVPRVLEGLKALRDHYVPMRLKGTDRRAFDKAMAKLRFEESPVKGTAPTARWGLGSVALDRHLKWGAGTDPRSMFRIYFFWNEADRQVVVGHLPTQLQG